MKHFRLFILFLMLALVASCNKDTMPVSHRQTEKNLQATIDTLMNNYKKKYPGYPGGLALKVISKTGSWFVSSGMGDNVTEEIHFRAASNTKCFTATAILLLAQQGKLNVDARISDTIPGTSMTYVPLDEKYSIPYRDEITIRLLLQHNAGVFDLCNDAIPATVSASVPYKGKNYLGYVVQSEPDHTFTFDELVGVVSLCKLSYFKPGTSHHYSNTGYSILGKIIERVSGESYSQFVTAKIIIPMGLAETSMPFSGTDQLLPAPYSKGYFYTPEILECTKSNISANVAEGTLITTPADLAKYLRALLRSDGVLKPFWVNSVMLAVPDTPDAGTYACGIYYTLNLGWGHNGAQDGYLSRMVSDPETDFTAVIYTNVWNVSDNMTSIVEQLYFLLEDACYKAKYIVQ
jgi:D-alanyl-D-alanine carboxypeptidase